MDTNQDYVMYLNKALLSVRQIARGAETSKYDDGTTKQALIWAIRIKEEMILERLDRLNHKQ